MIYGIVGSRDYSDLDAVIEFVDSLNSNDTVVSGAAKGVDSTAERAARERGLRVVSFPVDTSSISGKGEFRRRAMARNQKIVDKSTQVVAFWDSKSNGTFDSMNKAVESNKLLKVVFSEGMSCTVLNILSKNTFVVLDSAVSGTEISILFRNNRFCFSVDNREWEYPLSFEVAITFFVMRISELAKNRGAEAVDVSFNDVPEIYRNKIISRLQNQFERVFIIAGSEYTAPDNSNDTQDV